MWKSIIAPAVVVSLCWMVVGGSTSYYLSWLDRATDRVLAENVASIRAANEMEATVWRMQSSARDRSRVPNEVLTELESDFQRSLREAESAAKVAEDLLLNGIKSTSTGGTFDIHVVADETAAVPRVRFEDTGIGIPDNVLPRLFEPFVTSKDHGTGLGLAVSRRIVSNHSGRLLAENRSGGGDALTIELPLDHVPISRVELHAHAVAG